MARPRLFSIPPGAPFLPTFVAAFLGGTIVPGFAPADPLAMVSATIYVPTRRAARALAAELARAQAGRAALLPRILPLGETDEIEAALAFEESAFAEVETEGPPPAMDDFERRLALAALILAWGQALARRAPVETETGEGARGAAVAATPAQAWLLARDLASLMDELIIEDIPWSALDRAVPDEFDAYWSDTLNFLKIAREAWPPILAARGCTEAAARRAVLIAREAERIQAGASCGPVIAIGSTGTNKATALLLDAIARAPGGAVVLPGLDLDLDERAWSLAGDPRPETGAAGHPQAALRRLMQRLGASRDEAQALGAAPEALARRADFLREALLPAEATEHWPSFDRRGLAPALEGVSLVEAADEREEALALAARLREALETPGLTAALVTPDRAVAARVRAELARWSVAIDDSAGEPLAALAAGAFAILVLRAAAEDLFSIDALALLAHDWTRLGFDRERLRSLAALAELALARGGAPPGADCADILATARAAAQAPHAHPALRRARADDERWRDLETLAERLAQALGGLRALRAGAPLASWIEGHRAAIAAIGEAQRDGEDGCALEDLLDRLLAAAAGHRLVFDADDYLEFFADAARETAVHGRAGHPRLSILGLLEARLMSVDLVLLAGLDETVWPPAPAADPFLNRPMRAALGLSAPERRIGQTAHDFTQAMGAPRVLMSRALKRGRAPTTPSRFLQRMEALAGPHAWQACRGRGEAWLRLARLVDQAPSTPALAPPRPRPAVALRPGRLSVTRIETLRRDPYAIYAEFILGLTPLPPLSAPEARRAAGEEIHALLAEFARQHPAGPLPPDAAARLRARAQARFAPLLADVEWRAFHWPRFENAITAFVGWETERRGAIAEICVEERGELRLALADGSSFTLVAVADRLERRGSNRWTLLDYKSGRPPSPREVACGFAPQLTLEAAMLERGAFRCAPRPAVAEHALYLKLAGGEPICERPLKTSERELRALVDDHYEGMIALLSQFRDEATPYLSRPCPQFASRYGAYDHLARVKEWSSGASDGDEGA